MYNQFLMLLVYVYDWTMLSPNWLQGNYIDSRFWHLFWVKNIPHLMLSPNYPTQYSISLPNTFPENNMPVLSSSGPLVECFFKNILNSHNDFWIRQPSTVIVPPPSPSYVPPVLRYSHSHSLPSYLSPGGPVTMIILDVCKIWPDHYKVNWVDRWFHVYSVV